MSPAGRAVRVTSSRLVSLTQRAVAAICYQVEPVDAAARVVVQSELVANEQLPVPGGDPRRPAALQAPLQGEEHFAADGRAMLMHRTGRSDLRMAAAMDHRVDCAADLSQQAESWPDLARLTVAARLQPGQRLGIVKFAAFGWSGGRSRPAVRDQVEGALNAAVSTGWSGLLDEQRLYLADFWDRASVELDGDPEVEQAIRFALFHVLQAGAGRGAGHPGQGPDRAGL